MGIHYTTYSGRVSGVDSPRMVYPKPKQPESEIYDVVVSLPTLIVGGVTLSGLAVAVYKKLVGKDSTLRRPNLSTTQQTECDRLQRRYLLWNKLTAIATVLSLPAVVADISLQDFDQEVPMMTPERIVTLSAVGFFSLGGIYALIKAQNTRIQFVLQCTAMRVTPDADAHEFQDVNEFVSLPEALNPTAVGFAHKMFISSGHSYAIDWYAAGQAALIVGGAVLVVAAVIATDGAALAIIPAI